MKVIQVNEPMGPWGSVQVDRIAQSSGGIEAWLKRKAEQIEYRNQKKGTNVQGIYLYRIEAMWQDLCSGPLENTKTWKEMCYYIRFAYIK